MKRKFMSLALALLMLVSMGTTTASAEDSAAMYRNEASQISREALDAVMQKYVPANTINTRPCLKNKYCTNDKEV